jgi:hypothetical protein
MSKLVLLSGSLKDNAPAVGATAGRAHTVLHGPMQGGAEQAQMIGLCRQILESATDWYS